MGVLVNNTSTPHTRAPVNNVELLFKNMNIPQLVEVEQGKDIDFDIGPALSHTPLIDRGNTITPSCHREILEDPLIDRGLSPHNQFNDHAMQGPEPENSLHWFATTVLDAQPHRPIQELIGNHHLLVSKVHSKALMHAVDNYRAGNITHFLKNWEHLTSDREIISTVKYGLKLNTMCAISPRKPIQYNLSADESRTINSEIMPMLQKGIIELSEETPKDYFSPIFPRLKKSGDTRIILNLKALNKPLFQNISKWTPFEMSNT